MAQLFFTWQGQSIMDRPTPFESLMDCVRAYTDNLRPFCHCFSFIFEGYKTVRSFISMLLLLCAPLTIFGSIITIIVYAINRMFRRWTFAHIFQKVLKRTTPSPTHLYTALAVVFVGIGIFVIASLLHSDPRFIFSGIRFAVFCNLLFLVATTTYCCFSFKGTTVNYLCIATITTAFPIGFLVFCIRKFDHLQSAKFLTSKVYSSGATATLYTSGFNVVRFDNSSVSTITTALPKGSTSVGSISIFQNSQLVESLTRNVYPFHDNSPCLAESI